MKGYKLFRLRKDGTLGPLFINRSQVIEIGIDYPAENHPTKGFAVRKGWHLTLKPVAPHLNMVLKSGEKRVWAEVGFSDYTFYDRPESQGGAWVLANKMKVVKLRSDIVSTEGLDPEFVKEEK